MQNTAAAPAPTVSLRYSFDALTDNVVKPDGIPIPYIEARLSGPVVISQDGRTRGNALVFNGVDNLMGFPASFTGPQDVIKVSICPASNPGDAPAAWFSKRIANKQLDFPSGRAYWNPTNNSIDWGVVIHQKYESRVTRQQYVFAADSPTSGFRMQAWLEPGTGKFMVQYYGNHWQTSAARYLTLASKTTVWRKDVWTDIEFHIDQKNQAMRLVINGQEEARCLFSIAALQERTHPFTLGGSRRDGLPFYGKMDDFSISAGMPPENWIFPGGRMEYPPADYGAGIRLAYPLRPWKLESGRDVAEPDVQKPFEGAAAQKLVCGVAGSGLMAGPINLPAYKSIFSVGVAIRGEKPGGGSLAIGNSAELSSVFFTSRFDVDATFKALAFPDVITEGQPKYVFIVFDRPGTYWVDNLHVE